MPPTAAASAEGLPGKGARWRAIIPITFITIIIIITIIVTIIIPVDLDVEGPTVFRNLGAPTAILYYILLYSIDYYTTYYYRLYTIILD